MFNLDVLKDVFAQVEKAGKGEKTFEVVGVGTVVLRTLTPKEEVEVQQWASQAVEDDDNGQTYIALEYLDRFKLGILSYSIIEILGQDLRDSEFIETGDHLKNGKPVKVPKKDALRDLMEKWSRSLLISVFKKFVELSSEVEQTINKSIEFEPSELGSEITRVSKHLEELKEQHNEQKNPEEDPYQKQLRQIAEISEGKVPAEILENVTDEAAIEKAAPTEEPPTEEPPVTSRRSAIPTFAPPPPSSAPRAESTPIQPESIPQKIMPEEGSFVTSGDMADAVNAEAERLTILRQRRALLSEGAEPNVLNQEGDIGGIPVFKATETPGVLGVPPTTGSQIQFDRAPKGKANPRFAGNPKRA